MCGETIVRDFVLDVFKFLSRCLPSGPEWSIGGNIKVNMDARDMKDLRCIIFVERVITAIALQALLTELLPKLSGWKTEYTAGNQSGLQSQSRKKQNEIVEEFRKGTVNIIVATSILEEGLDVQSCNLVIRSDPSATVCSFIQSRGCAQMQNSDFLVMVRSGDASTLTRVKNYLASGDIMRKESLSYASIPCAPLDCELFNEISYRVESTDAFVTLSSSVGLIHFYCSRLPSDGGDASTLTRVKNYLASGDIMRKESLSYASIPCAPLDCELFNEISYRVESTDAVVTLSSSAGLIHFYCSRLPSDGYFKPSPCFNIDEELETCTLYILKSCPVQNIRVKGNIKMLKQLACLEACKQLHQCGALTDNLVPDIVVEEAVSQELGNEIYSNDQPKYFPPELVSHCVNDSMDVYHRYLIQLRRHFDYDIPIHDIVFALRTELELDDDNMTIDLEVDRGSLTVHVKYVVVKLDTEKVLLCQGFQVTIFRALLDHNFNKLRGVLDAFHLKNDFPVCDYLLLPSTGSHHNPPIIDWKCISSVRFPRLALGKNHTNCSLPKGYAYLVKTKNGSVCSCMLENSVVCTPHNGNVYCITGTLNNMNGNSLLRLRNGQAIPYKKYCKSRRGIGLCFESESLLNGRHIFPVQNCLQWCRQQEEKDRVFAYCCELEKDAHGSLHAKCCYSNREGLGSNDYKEMSFLPTLSGDT